MYTLYFSIFLYSGGLSDILNCKKFQQINFYYNPKILSSMLKQNYKIKLLQYFNDTLSIVNSNDNSKTIRLYLIY